MIQQTITGSRNKGWVVEVRDPQNASIMMTVWVDGSRRDAESEASIARRELIARMIDES